MKYRKKPVVIEARQLVGSASDFMDVYQWVEGYMGSTHPPVDDAHLGIDQNNWHGVTIDPGDGSLVIRTLEGDMKATPGDYIIRGIQGEFYPCKPDIFEQTHEVAE